MSCIDKCRPGNFALISLVLMRLSSADFDPSKTIYLGSTTFLPNYNFTISLLLFDSNGVAVPQLNIPYPTMFLSLGPNRDQTASVRYATGENFANSILNVTFIGITQSGRWTLQMFVFDYIWPITNITISTEQFSPEHSILANKAIVRAGVLGFLVLTAMDIYGNPTLLTVDLQNVQVSISSFCTFEGFCSSLPNITFGNLDLSSSTTYTMAYMTTRSGMYTVRLDFSAMSSQINYMSANVTVRPQVPAPQNMVLDDLPMFIPAGVLANFSLQGRDVYGNNLTTFWTDDGLETTALSSCQASPDRCGVISQLTPLITRASLPIPAPNVDRIDHGRVHSSFALTQSGSYLLDVILPSLLKNGSTLKVPIASSPYYIVVYADESGFGTSVSFTLRNLSVPAGQNIELNMTEFDKYLNQRTMSRADFVVSLIQGNSFVQTINVSVLEGGKYKLSFVPTKSGNYTIQCKFSLNVLVPSSSFSLQVVPGLISASGTQVVPASIQVGSVDSINSFEVVSADSFQNRIFSGGLESFISFNMVACLYPRIPCSRANWSSFVATSKVQDTGGGYYELTYSTTVGGWYSASVLVAGELVIVNGQAAPFSILVDAGFTDASKSIAFASSGDNCLDIIAENVSLLNVLSCSDAGPDSGFKVRIKDRFGNWRLAQRSYTYLRFSVHSVKLLMTQNDSLSLPHWNEKRSQIVNMSAGLQEGATSIDPGTFNVNFYATICGLYSVDVYVYDCEYNISCIKGAPIENSPVLYFIKPSAPFAPYSNIVAGQQINLATAGKLSKVAIFSRDQFRNQIWRVRSTAFTGIDWVLEVDTGNCGQSSGSFVKCPRGFFSGSIDGYVFASFNVTVAGIYKVKIFMSSSKAFLSESPYNISVLSDVGSSKSLILGDVRLTNRAGLFTSINIQTVDKYGNFRRNGGDNFSLYVQFWNATSMYTTDFQNGTYELSISITRTGLYKIWISVNEMVVSGSPLNMVVSPGLADPTRSMLVFPSSLSTAGNVFNFIIRSWDRYFNPLISGGDTYEVLCLRNSSRSGAVGSVGDFRNGSYSAACTMTASGNYQVFVSLLQSGLKMQLLEIPFSVSVFPDHPSVLFSSARGDSITLVTAGIFSTFIVSGRDQFGNPTLENTGFGFYMKIFTDHNAIKSETLKTICWEPDIEWNSTCHSYNQDVQGQNLNFMNFSVTRSGNYTLILYVSGLNSEILSTPLWIEPSYTDVSNSFSYGTTCSLGTVGHTMIFFVQTKDYFGNIRRTTGGIFQVKMYDINDTITGNVSSMDLNDGRHAISYFQTRSGIYHMSITGSNISIVNSPKHIILVSDASDFSQFAASGQGISVGAVESTNSFYLQSKDKYGNLRSEGNDSISVFLLGGWTHSFDRIQLDEAKAFGVVTYMSLGRYVVEYTVNRSGTFSLSIRGKQTRADPNVLMLSIHRSPFNVIIIPGRMESSTSVLLRLDSSTLDPSTLNHENGQNSTAGNQDSFLIQAKDKYGNPLTMGGDEQYINVSMERYVTVNTVTENTSNKSLVLLCSVVYRGALDESWTFSGQYVATYPATIAGTYTVTTLFKGSPLSGSGYDLILFPGPSEARMCSALFPVVQYNEQQVYRVCTAGISSSFLIISKDKYDNVRSIGGDTYSIHFSNMSNFAKQQLNASMINREASNLSFQILDERNGQYIAFITPTLSGDFYVEVALGDYPICRSGCSAFLKSPYSFKVIANEVYGPLCTAWGQALEVFQAGVPATFQIQAKDFFGNNRTQGRFLNGKYSGEFFQSNIVLQGPLRNRNLCTCRFGVCTFCDSIVCDAFSSCPKFSLSPSVVGVNDPSNNDGIYAFRYSITRASSYSIAILKLYRGQLLHISGSPFDLRVVAAETSAAHSFAVGDGLKNTIAGSFARFLVRAIDIFGNVRTKGHDSVVIYIGHTTKCQQLKIGDFGLQPQCVLCGRNDTICTEFQSSPGMPMPLTVMSNITDFDNGTYTVGYTPTISGLYSIKVKIDQSDIGVLTGTKSPFLMQCSPSLLDASASTVSAPDGSNSLVFSISMASTLILRPRDRFGNDLADSSIKMQVSLCDLIAGMICTARPGQSYVQVTYLDMETGMTYHLQEKFSNSVIGNVAASTSVQATIQTSSDGSYVILFYVQKVGIYLIDVKLMDPYRGNILSPIFGSPLNMTVVPVDNNPDPKYSRFSALSPSTISAGNLFLGQLIVKNRFNAIIQSAANGQVSLEFSSDNPSTIAPSMINQQNGTFSMVFTLTVSGNYIISILVTDSNGNWAEVLGSPATFQVTPASLDILNSVWQTFNGNFLRMGTAFETTTAGQDLVIFISCRDRYKNQISAYATSMSKIVPAVSLIRISTSPLTFSIPYTISIQPTSGLYIVTFAEDGNSAVTQSGRYTLSVQISGFEVSNSPSVFAVVPSIPEPTLCFAYIDGKLQEIAGEQNFVMVQSKDKYGNNRTAAGDNFAFTYNGSNTAMTTNIYQGSGISQILFTMTIAATYFVHVSLNGDDILNSPFRITVVPAYASAGYSRNITEIPSKCTAGIPAMFRIQAADIFGNFHIAGGEIFDVFVKGIVTLRTFNADGVRCINFAFQLSQCVAIYDLHNGKYDVFFTLFKSGPYVVEAYLRDHNGNVEQIGMNAGSSSASPWKKCRNCPTLDVGPTIIDVRTILLVGDGQSATAAGAEATYTIIAKDAYGNDQTAGGVEFFVALEASNEESISALVQDMCILDSNKCGSYFVSYTLTISGNYQTIISANVSSGNNSRMVFTTFCAPALLASAQMSGLPFDSSSASLCTKRCSSIGRCCLDGEAASYGVVGQDMTFIIQARDMYGNSLSSGGDSFSILMQGPSAGESSITELDSSRGQYLARYRVYMAGTYFLFVKLRGVDVGYMYDASSESNTTQFVGSPFPNLEISNQGTGLEGLAISDFPGSFEADSIISILITASDPTSLRILQRNSNKIGIPALVASITWVDTLYPMIEASQFDSTMYPNKKQVLNTFIPFSDNNSTFKLVLKFTVAGRYALSISSGNYLIQIPQSPMTVIVVPENANISQTYLAGAWQSAVYGQDSRIFVTARDKFGNFRSRCRDRSIDTKYCTDTIRWSVYLMDSAAAPLSLIADGCEFTNECSIWQGQYLLTPAYTSSGFFCLSIQILIDKQYVTFANSGKGACTSIKVNVVAPSDVGLPDSVSLAYGDGLHGLVAGSAATFTITSRDQSTNVVQSTATDFIVTFRESQSGSLIQSNLTKTGLGTFVVRQTITRSSLFSVSIVLQRTNFPILSSPFTLFVISGPATANCSVADGTASWLRHNGLMYGVSSAEAEFTVQLRDRFGNDVKTITSENVLYVQIERDSTFPVDVLVSDSFCTDSSKSNILECYSRTCGSPPCWHARDGLYKVVYSSSITGYYTINVSFASKVGLTADPLAGSNFLRTVVSGQVSQGKSYAIGSALDEMTAGKPSIMTIVVRDQFGNLINTNPHPTINITSSLGNGKDKFWLGSWISTFEYISYPLLTIAGEYTADIDLNGTQLEGSPFHVKVWPAETDYKMCTAEGVSLSYVIAGTQSRYTIIARDSYSNQRTTGGEIFKLSASLITSQGVTGSVIQGNVLDSNNGTYLAAINLTLPGRYSALISLGADEVLRYSFDCVPGPVNAKSSYLQKAIPQLIKLPGQEQDPYGIGLIYTLGIQARDIFGSKSPVCDNIVSIKINRTSAVALNMIQTSGNQSVDCALGFYQSKLHLSVSGQYSVSIRFFEEDIFQSPFLFSVSAGSVAAFQCTASGIVSIVQAGITQTFLIQSRDQYGNALRYDPFTPMNKFGAYLQLLGSPSCSVSGTPESNISVCIGTQLVDNMDSSYLVSYTPTLSGKYELVVFLLSYSQTIVNYLPIAQSPFLTEILPGPLSVSSIQATSTISTSFSVNSYVTFDLEARDAFGNSICSGISSALCSQRRGSGLGINAVLFWYAPSYEIFPRKKSASVIDQLNGLYQVSFQLTLAAHYSLDISVNGWRIYNSPFKFYQLPSILDVSQSTVEGGGAVGGFVGHSAAFKIVARDQFGNELTSGGAKWLIDIFTPSDISLGLAVASLSPAFNDNGDGTYSVEYLTSEVGNHLLRVQGYVGSNILLVKDGYNQFVKFVVKDDFAVPSKSISIGEGILGGRAGRLLKFELLVRNIDGLNQPQGGSLVTANLMKADDTSLGMINMISNDNKDGTYTFQYTCTVSGIYRLSVLISGQHTQGSPFSVQILSGFASRQASRTSRLFPSMAGTVVKFQIQAFDEFGNLEDYDEFVGAEGFMATLYHESRALTLITDIFDNKDGSYVCSYAATISGLYQMKLYLDSALIKQVDNIVVTPSTISSSTSSVDLSGLYLLSAGNVGVVHIAARDSFGNEVQDGSGLFNGTVIGRMGTSVLGYAVPCDAACVATESCPCSQLSLATYGFRLNFLQSGGYNLFITISNEIVSGSPFLFTVAVGQVSTVNSTLIGCENQCGCQDGICSACNCTLQMASDGHAPILIQSRDLYGNAVTEGGKAFQFYVTQSSFTGSSTGTCSQKVCPAQIIVRDFATDLKSGKYEIDLQLTQSGEYFLIVTRNSVHIIGSPFSLRIVPGLASSLPNGCYFFMDLNILAGQQETVGIISRDAYGNQLTQGGGLFYIFVVGNGISYQGNVVDVGDGTYKAHISVNFAGSYHCQVTLGDSQIYPYSILFVVAPALVDAALSLVYGPGLDPVQSIGSKDITSDYTPARIYIVARDRFRNTYNSDDSFFAIMISGPINMTRNSSLASFVTYEGCGLWCGRYIIENSFTVAGKYNLDVLYYPRDRNGFLLPPSHLLQHYPFEIRVVNGNTDASSSFARGSGLTVCTADVRCFFSIQAADSFGNFVTFSGDLFSVNIVSLVNPSQQLSPDISRGRSGFLGSGLYRTTYQATVSGMYVMRITLHGYYIQDMPVSLIVFPGQVHPSACTADGMGMIVAVLGEQHEMSIMITARDIFGNAFFFGSEIDMLSSDFACSEGCRLRVDSDPNIIRRVPMFAYAGNSPQYVAMYQFKYSIPSPSKVRPSELLLNISVSEHPIEGSPFTVSVRNSIEIRSFSLRSTPVCPGISLPNGATSQDCDISRFSLLLDPHQCLSDGCPVGTQLSLIVLTRDVSGAFISTGRKFIASICTGYSCIECLNCNAGRFNVSYPTSQLQCCTTNLPGQAIIAFSTTKLFSARDIYMADIRLLADYADSNIPIYGSPFQLTLVPGNMSYENSLLHSISQNPKVGIKAYLVLILMDHYGNNRQYDADAFNHLYVNSSGPAMSTVVVQDNGDGSFNIIFSGTQSGIYFVHVQYSDGISTSKKSAVIDLAPDESVIPSCTAKFFSALDSFNNVISNNALIITAGAEISISVQSRDAFGNAVLNPIQQNFFVNILNSMTIMKHSFNGSYVTVFTITLSGSYNIKIFGSQGGCFEFECPQISGSPFNLSVSPSVIDSSACSYAGSGIAFGIANSDASLSIVARDRFGNRLQQLSKSDSISVFLTVRAESVKNNILKYSWSGNKTLSIKGTVASSVMNGNILVTYKAYMPGIYSLKGYINDMRIGILSSTPEDCSAVSPCPQIVPASSPSIMSCAFSNSGGHIYIEFDQETNRAGQRGIFACSILFDDFTCRRLSSNGNSWCAFLNPSKLDIVLGYGATISVNDDLAWKSGILFLKEACIHASRDCFQYSLSVEGSVRVGRPKSPIKAVAVLKAPTKVGPCDDLLLDASFSYGSAGRPMQYVFGLVPGNKNDNVVRDFIGKQEYTKYTTNQLLIPRDILSDGATYTFVVSVSNFLDETSLDSTVVQAQDLDVPLISIEGPKVIVSRSTSTLRLRGSAQLSSCHLPNDSIEFEWSLIAVSPAPNKYLVLDTLTQSTRVLLIQANTLSPGYNYTFQLTGISNINRTLFATASVTVTCSYGDLLAIVDGGNRAISIFTDIMLDASRSVDFDGTQSSYEFQYKWSCESTLGSACFADYEGIITGADSTLIIPRGRLVSGTYLFSVTVYKEPGPRMSTAFSTLYVLPNNQSYVEIENIPKLKINSNERLVLTGHIEPGCYSTWTQTAGDSVLQYPGLLSTPLNLTSIAFLPNSLYPGSAYTFRLISTCRDNTGFAEISVITNSIPSSGTFIVNPTVGKSSFQPFNLFMSGWVDDIEDLPFKYEFRYSWKESPQEEVPLGLIDLNWMEVYLPAVKNATLLADNITLIGIVRDSFDGQARVETGVQIIRSGSEEVDLVQAAESIMSNFIATGNSEGIIQLVIALSSTPNLTCVRRDSMVIMIQDSASKVSMRATDIAQFSSSIKALLEAKCVQGGLRFLTDQSVVTALQMTNKLLVNSQLAGLDPAAELVFVKSLGLSLDIISKKNGFRRKLRSLLKLESENSRGNKHDLNVFSEALNLSLSLTSNSDPGELLISAAANLATSHLLVALPGEDAKLLLADSLKLMSVRKFADGYSGKTIGMDNALFTLPSNLFQDNYPMDSFYLNMAASPYYSSFEVNEVSSLSFETKILELMEPIEIQLSSSSLNYPCPDVHSGIYSQDLSTCGHTYLDTCRFWDGRGWDGEGCIVDKVERLKNTTFCICYHLTEFASVPVIYVPNLNVLNPLMPGVLFESIASTRIVVLCFFCCSLMMYVIMLYWGWRRDSDEFGRNITESKSEKQQSRIQNNLNIEEERTLFLSKHTHLLQRAFKEKYILSLLIVKNKIMRRLSKDHKLLGCFARSTNNFTRPRRITVLFCTISGYLMINAIFCGDDSTTFVQKLVGGILASLLMMPVYAFFRTIFITLDVNNKTHEVWERQVANRAAKNRSEISKTLHTGPTAAGIASPPQNLKESGAPSRINRGYIPRPDQIQMFGGLGVKDVLVGRFKRKVKFNPMVSQSDTSNGNSRLGAVSEQSMSSDKKTDYGRQVPDTENFDPISIPRRALPIHAVAKPPAPSVFFPISEDGEIVEDKQEIILGETGRAVSGRIISGKAIFQSQVAKAVVSTLVKSDQKKTKKLIHRRFQVAAYAMAYLWFLICAYVGILFGIRFPADFEVAWAIAVALSMLLDFVVSEVVIISFITAFKYFILPKLIELLAGFLSEKG